MYIYVCIQYGHFCMLIDYAINNNTGQNDYVATAYMQPFIWKFLVQCMFFQIRSQIFYINFVIISLH